MQQANSVFAGKTAPPPPTPPALADDTDTDAGTGACPRRGAAAGTCDKHEGHHHHHHGDADGHHHHHGAAARRLQSDSPSGEDQGANFYGVSHFPCCITNFPQGWPKFAASAVLINRTANAFVLASLLPLNATLPAEIGGGAKLSVQTDYPLSLIHI